MAICKIHVPGVVDVEDVEDGKVFLSSICEQCDKTIVVSVPAFRWKLEQEFEEEGEEEEE